MKSLLFSALLLATSSAADVLWTGAHSDLVEQSTLVLTPKLRQQTAIIGRLGLAETHVGVLLGKDGHIVAPYLRSIDGEDAPYLLYRPDGSRIELTTVVEKPKRFLALLKLDAGLPDAPELPIAELSQHTVVLPSCAPIASVGEQASFLVDHLKYAPEEDSEVFRLNQTLAFPGTSVFDLAGNLLGFTLMPERAGTSVLTITKVIAEIPQLADLLPDLISPDLPKLPLAPKLTKEEIGDLNEGIISEVREQSGTRFLPNPLPCVLVFNEGAPLTHSAIGTIVRSDGLILSKASELGPSLNVRYGGQNFTGLLLATDEETDLALIAIDATNLPVVAWTPHLPEPGQTLVAPILLKENTEEMVSEEKSSLGTFSHLLNADAPTLQSSSKVTSLGLYTEQISSGLVIAALAKDAPAYESGLAPGDLLVSIDDTKLPNRTALAAILKDHRVGDEVTVKVIRGDSPQDFKVKLTAPLLFPPATGIDPRTGLTMIPSVRRSPFPDVLVHTAPLNAWDCGSPLYNRQGQAIGLNIAAVSAGRTLALLPQEIEAALDRLLSRSRPF